MLDRARIAPDVIAQAYNSRVEEARTRGQVVEIEKM